MGIHPVTEEQFMATVIEFALLHNWMLFHVRDSRGSPAGFPDLVFAKGGQLVFAELKIGTNKPTLAQRLWLEELAEVAKTAPSVRVYLWKPENWDVIERVLGGES